MADSRILQGMKNSNKSDDTQWSNKGKNHLTITLSIYLVAPE